MTGPLKTALTLSFGLHAGALFGWPGTSPVAFDVERAPTSMEVWLVAPRAAPATAQEPLPIPEPIRPETTSEPVQEPDPVPQTVVTPELRGALAEVLPRDFRNPAPVYPVLARQRGIEGLVLIEVEVLPSGRCGRLRVRRGPSLLAEAAAEAVAEWRFRPARRGAGPMAVWIDIPFRFRLIDAGGSR